MDAARWKRGGVSAIRTRIISLSYGYTETMSRKITLRTAATWLPMTAVTAVILACVGGAAPATSIGGGPQVPGVVAAPKPATPPGSAVIVPPPAIPLHAPLDVSDARPFADEGLWRALATTADGRPAVQGTEVRAQGTGETAAVAWIHQPDVRFELHPGYEQPGGTWSQPDMLPRDKRKGLLATWNGGFLMYQSGGGFYLDGRQHGPLRDGAASEVFFKDGSMTVGRWGRDVSMTTRVEGVRQQLHLLVDDGRIANDVDSLFTWGVTDAGATYVRRSGVGVTAQGDVVYAIGPLLSPRSLALALQQAGAVRAMELDINISWPSFMAYDSSRDPLKPKPFKFGNFPRAAERYFSPSARDFVAVYGRSD